MLPAPRAWRTGRASFGLFAGQESRPFNAGGQGLGGFFRERMVVNFSHLPRPPRGYAYRAWLVKADNTAKDWQTKGSRPGETLRVDLARARMDHGPSEPVAFREVCSSPPRRLLVCVSGDGARACDAWFSI